MRRIARTLTDWREAHGLTAAELATRVGWSAAKQSRVENATQPIKPAEVMTLALVLGIPEAERDTVFNSCLAAQQRGWWEEIGREALVDDVRAYVELESEASTVRTFKVDLVEGLLQTEEYAAAIGEAYVPRASAKVIRQRVDARRQRQKRLFGENPIRVEAVLTEGALRTQVGGVDVMRQQLRRLNDLSELHSVDLRVIPARGAYPAMGTPFYILSFATGYQDIGYIELIDRGIYLEQPDEVEPYRTNFRTLQGVALDPDDSYTLIAKIARSLR